MTDRVRYLTVILDADYREDDAQAIAGIVRGIRHVASVELGEPVTGNDLMNRKVVGMDMEVKLLEFFRSFRK